MRRGLWLSLALATLAYGQTSTPKSATPPEQVLRRYLEAWARDDTEAMYRLTTREGQRQIVFDEFATLVRGGFRATRPFPGAGPGPGPNQGGGGFRREPPGEDGFRILHIYPPQLHGDWASVSFTLQFRDGRLERNPAFLVREEEEWRFPMHFDETTRTWHLPPSAPTRVPFGGRPGFGEGRGGMGPFGAGFGGDNRTNVYSYALRHLAAAHALERLGRNRMGDPGREGPGLPPPGTERPPGKTMTPSPPEGGGRRPSGAGFPSRPPLFPGVESITPDPRTNSLIIRATERGYQELRRMLEAIDQPQVPIQLSFEFAVVSATEANRLKDLKPAPAGTETPLRRLVRAGKARLLSSPSMAVLAGGSSWVATGGKSMTLRITSRPTTLDDGSIQVPLEVEFKGDEGAFNSEMLLRLRDGVPTLVLQRASQKKEPGGARSLVLMVTGRVSAPAPSRNVPPPP